MSLYKQGPAVKPGEDMPSDLGYLYLIKLITSFGEELKFLLAV